MRGFPVTRKLKLPKRTDGGCIAYGNAIVCTSTTTGILKPKHMKMIGRGIVTIPAYMAGAVPKYIEELSKDCPLVYQEEITEIIRNQLCSWCDGHGWQTVNMMENVVACSNCSGTGIEPVKTRKKLTPLTSKAREKILAICDWLKEKKTVEWIARKLKITRERVRQLLEIGKARKWPTRS